MVYSPPGVIEVWSYEYDSHIGNLRAIGIGGGMAPNGLAGRGMIDILESANAERQEEAKTNALRALVQLWLGWANKTHPT